MGKVHKIKKEDLMPPTSDLNNPIQPIGLFSVPNIPVQPIGYDTAREIMKRLGNTQTFFELTCSFHDLFSMYKIPAQCSLTVTRFT